MSLRDSHYARQNTHSHSVRKGVPWGESQSRSDVSYGHIGNVPHSKRLLNEASG